MHQFQMLKGENLAFFFVIHDRKLSFVVLNFQLKSRLIKNDNSRSPMVRFCHCAKMWGKNRTLCKSCYEIEWTNIPLI